MSRFNRVTGEVEHLPVRPPAGVTFRSLRTVPLLFSEVDPHVMYMGMQVVVEDADGGHTWETISPDLSRETYALPASVAAYPDAAKQQATRRGVVYSLAPSRLTIDTIWAGTDDGLIHVTRDGGKTWKNVTPAAMAPWSKIAQLDASHFDDQTVYAAVNRLRLDDLKPHIFRTHDGGATWTEIVRGLPDGPVNSVREDPVRKGLLFAGTETATYVSFNDGDDWHAAAAEHAGHIDPRSGDSRERSGGGHARPRLLDSRRYCAAAAIDAGSRGRARASVRAERGLPIPARYQYRYAIAARGARGTRIRRMARFFITT